MRATRNGLRDRLLFPLHATLAVPPHDSIEGGYTSSYLGKHGRPRSPHRHSVGLVTRWLRASWVWISQPGPDIISDEP
jgi:hypothetical protein